MEKNEFTQRLSVLNENFKVNPGESRWSIGLILNLSNFNKYSACKAKANMHIVFLRASVLHEIFEIIDYFTVWPLFTRGSTVKKLADWLSRICWVFWILNFNPTLPASVFNESSCRLACIKSFSSRTILSANARSLTLQSLERVVLLTDLPLLSRVFLFWVV